MAFGDARGHPAGTNYKDYAEMIQAGIHRQRNVGMVGGATRGTESVVLNGGYIDDLDLGDEVVYTGFGGRDTNGRQVADQEWVGANEGMRVNLAHGIPVRVIRGWKGEPAFSPASGYRYDGLYQVDETWQEHGADGYIICRFRLSRMATTPPPPPSAPPPVAPKRVATTVLRRVRDSAMTRRIKDLHDFTCQVCGQRLLLPGGVAYAEGAHIRPLGTPHDGDDTEGNVLCLCPNDHLLLDRGAMYVTDGFEVVDGATGLKIGNLRLVTHHAIDLDHVRYHRSMFGY